MGTLQSQIRSPRNEVERKIAELGPWFHNIRLPDGTQTAPEHPLGDFPSFKWTQIAPHIPADLSGYRVLDIGCNAGFYSLELARRGAQVDALDVDERYLRQARWVFEQHDLSDRIQARQGSVYGLMNESSAYDIVWFMGVLYHLRYPMLALDIVARKVRQTLVFQTLEMPGNSEREVPRDLPINERAEMCKEGWPRMAFIEHSLAADPTNWWAPDNVCTRAMLRSAGLRITATPDAEIYVCEPDDERDVSLRSYAEADFNAISRNFAVP